MTGQLFRANSTYDNVYFLFVDAAGYSSIVSLNPRDRAAHAFDLLRNRLVARVNELAAEHRCARTALWNWRGDGGLFAIHDENESTARDVALEAGRCMLTLDLRHLREELRLAALAGELHIRMAIHKGAIRYSSGNQSGSIHSPDINFTAHLEKATPPNCLTISEDVYRVSGGYADLFEPVGNYENQNIYLMQPGAEPKDARRSWLRIAGLANGVPVHAYPERPSQHEKARLIEIASSDVLDLGAALNTCAGYLVTTERPALYRDAILGFLQRGGTYRCVLLDPKSEAAGLYSKLRQEDLPKKIEQVMANFARFKQRYGYTAEGLHVYHTSEFPGLHALCIDLLSPDALILYSPYLFGTQPSTSRVERGDMPYYLATTDSGQLLTTLTAAISNATTDKVLVRVL
jgi:class 3 adenylate cyclase